MIRDACEARDKVHSLLLEGDVEAALHVAQTLTVLGSDQEFENFMQRLLAVALDDKLYVGGDFPERTIEQHSARLTADQQVVICNAVEELRQDRRYNTTLLAVSAC